MHMHVRLSQIRRRDGQKKAMCRDCAMVDGKCCTPLDLDGSAGKRRETLIAALLPEQPALRVPLVLSHRVPRDAAPLRHEQLHSV